MKARESEGARGPAVEEGGRAAEGGSSDATERRGRERGAERQQRSLSPPPTPPTALLHLRASGMDPRRPSLRGTGGNFWEYRRVRP